MFSFKVNNAELVIHENPVYYAEESLSAKYVLRTVSKYAVRTVISSYFFDLQRHSNLAGSIIITIPPLPRIDFVHFLVPKKIVRI